MEQPAAPPQRVDFATTLDRRTKTFTVIGALLGLFLSALDQTIVSTALRTIARDLHGMEQYTWVVTSYLLASTAMVPVYGKLSDIYGRRSILLFGIGLFLTGSALCGASTSMLMLILMRGVQGLGAAAITSTAFIIVADLFDPRTRAKVQGSFGAVFGLSSVIGPLLGGLLTDHVSWRWVFYVNIPVGLVAVSFILARMPPLKTNAIAKVDYLGSLTLLLGAVPLLLALSMRRPSPLAAVLLLVGLAGLGLFLYVESRAESPLLPLSIFKNQAFARPVAVSFFFGGAFFGAVVFIPLFMQEVVLINATKSGFTMTPLTLTMVVGAFSAGQLSARVGRTKPFIVGGLAVVTLAYWLLSQLNTDATQLDVSWRMLVLGIGFGPCLPLLNVLIQNSVPRAEVGIATSTRQFVQQFGSVFGAAVMGAVLGITLTGELKSRTEPLLHPLPADVRAKLEVNPSHGLGEETTQDHAQLQEEAKQGIEAQFQRWSDDFHRALLQGDAAARARLSSDPELPSTLKSFLAASSAEAAPTEAIAQQDLQRGKQFALTEAEQVVPRLALARREAFVTAITHVFWTSLVFIFIALAIAVRLHEVRLSKTPVPTQASIEA